MTADPVLTPSQRDLLAQARRAVLATIALDGRPRLIPICFVLDEARPVLYTPLDEKPKLVVDPRLLARVRDLLRDPRVTILVDRWDEDWTRLAWLRSHGMASLLEPAPVGAGGANEHREGAAAPPVDGAADDVDGALGHRTAEHGAAVAALRAKYPQYLVHDLAGRPLIRIEIERTTSWGRLGETEA